MRAAIPVVALPLALLLFVACEDVLEPPQAASAKHDLDDLPDDRVKIELTRYGKIRHGGKVINLNQLGALLKERVEVYGRIKKAVGKSGWEPIPGGGKASKLNLVIRADKQAPWQHVQWLLTEAAMNKYYKVFFATTLADGKPGRVQAFLPTDKAVPQDPKNQLVMSVHVIARKERAVKWAGIDVTLPTKFLYKSGARQSSSVKVVEKWVAEVWKTVADHPNLRFHAAEIRAGHKVPFGRIVELMGVIHKLGQKKIDFYGTQIAHAKLRKKMRLPYPKSNYGRKN